MRTRFEGAFAMSEAMTLEDFCAYPWPSPELLLSPWLPRIGISMIFGPAGVGKTYFSLACALTVAEVGPSRIPGMERKRCARVLYVDAEMDPADMVRRFAKLNQAQKVTAEGRFSVLPHAKFRDGIPDLGIEDGPGRKLIEDEMQEHEADVLWLDNKSALLRSGDANSEDSITSFTQWLLKFRRANKSVVLVHHSGKGQMDKDGNLRVTQRGSSKLTDNMDSVLQLLQIKRGDEAPNVLPILLEYEKHRHWIPSSEGVTLCAHYGEGDDRCWYESGLPKRALEWVDWAKEYRAAGHTLSETTEAVKAQFPDAACSLATLKRHIGSLADLEAGSTQEGPGSGRTKG
jgi:RecA-family ATPase